MSNSFNVVGRLGKDPEPRYSKTSGKLMATLSVASSSGFKDAQGNYKTDWFYCKSYFENKSKYIIDHLKKGDLVWVTGRIETYEKEDRSTGFAVVISEISRVAKGDNAQGTGAANNTQAGQDARQTAIDYGQRQQQPQQRQQPVQKPAQNEYYEGVNDDELPPF